MRYLPKTRVLFFAQPASSAAWKMQDNEQIRGERTKAVPQDIFLRHVPRSLFGSPTMRSKLPFSQWMNRYLRVATKSQVIIMPSDWCDYLVADSQGG